MAFALKRQALASLQDALDALRLWHARRALALRASFVLFLLLALSGIAMVHLFALLTERSWAVRQELLQRDLRDLVGRFDADERFVVEHNIQELLEGERVPRPLLLPRQYYTALPASDVGALPRQPPRNCFVKLVPITGDAGEDRLCAYFVENRAPGRFLFLNMRLADDDIVPLRQGDGRFRADAVRLTVELDGRTGTWWLMFQQPASTKRRARYEITAFREVAPGQLERDRKLEGWAYEQGQPAGAERVYMLARLDFKEFMSDEESWPPSNWKATRLKVERQEVRSNQTAPVKVEYKNSAIAELSISALASPIFTAHGTVSVESVDREISRSWKVRAPIDVEETADPIRFPIKYSKGDILWSANPTELSEPLADTGLIVTASQSWRYVEKVFWIIALYLLALFALAVFTAFYFRKQLLEPITDWARQSKELASVRTGAAIELPYAKRQNEVGTLATAINALISLVRTQAAREHEAIEEELRNRTQNLKVIAHEIRAPLQALLALHTDEADRSKRHVDRMYAALPNLLGGGSTADAIRTRPIRARRLDVARFLVETAFNAGSVIEHLLYEGPTEGVFCQVDDGAFEDVLDKLLHNAQRHRVPGTPIQITLRVSGKEAIVGIENIGKQIPEELAQKIYGFGVSTVEQSDGHGQGVGLYVARDYIHRMNGGLFHQNLAAGVIFLISLPIASESRGYDSLRSSK